MSRSINCVDWQKSRDLPSDMYVLGVINNKEFLVGQADSAQSIDKYLNVLTHLRPMNVTNKCTKLFECPDPFKTDECAVAYDSDTQTLYLYCPFHGSIYVKNLEHMNCYQIVENKATKTGDFPIAIALRNTLHIIGGQDNNTHIVWSDETKEFEEMHVFEHFADSGFIMFRLIHIASRKSFLFIGGEDADSGDGLAQNVLEFSLETNTWTALNVAVPQKIRDFGYVVTRNDQFVLLFAPYIGSPDALNRSDSTFVLDVQKMKFGKCNIKLPMNVSFYDKIVIYNDYEYEEILTFGFIRNVWTQIDIGDRYAIECVPQYLCKLMQSYYANDYLYTLRAYRTVYWKISVDDILHHTDFDCFN
eukprot:673437_1